MQGESQSMPNIARQSEPESIDKWRQMSQSRTSLGRQKSGIPLSHLHYMDNYRLAPFNLRWIHGYNHKVGAMNLNNNGSTIAFYTAANCGVLYNWSNHQMHLLQGHKHVVTCIASDKTGEWLVTADSGPENVLIIWCSTDLFPQKTIFSPHGSYKIAKVALSGDAKYLLTMAYSGGKVMLYWWIWSYGFDVPHATIELQLSQENHKIIAMSFNPYLSEQFILLSKCDLWVGIAQKVVIIERGLPKVTNNYELIMKNPTKDISLDHGNFTCFTCVEKTRQILVGTTRGAVYIYGYNIEYHVNPEYTVDDFEQLRFIKLVKIEKRQINVIKSVDDVIITGNNIGELHFYDDQLKLLYWMHELHIGCIMDISFNLSPRSYEIFDTKCKKACMCWDKVQTEVDPATGVKKQKLLKMQLPFDATTSGKAFLVRDFIICTLHNGVGFLDFVTETLETIIDNRLPHVSCMSVHPEKTFVCLGFADGVVEIYNFVTHRTLKRLNLREYFTIVIQPKDDSIHSNYETIVPCLSVTCIQYAPSGLHLACGLNTGELVFLDPCTIELVTPKSHADTKHPIKQMAFSMDSLTMAMADLGKTVCVYKYDCSSFKWQFIGKHRAHYKDIVSLIFLPEKTETGDYKLLSLGRDRIMVEYDISGSFNESLEIFSLDRMEQSAVPLTGILWPTAADLDPDKFRTDLPMILVANDEYKYKIVNYSTTMTLSTILGPRYETPVSKIRLISKKDGDDNQQYLLFTTKDVIGMQKMPLDGNPWKHVGMLGHPVRISQMDYRDDFHMLFTIGDKDTILMQWAANYRAVEVSNKCGGEELNPYYCLLDNMRTGWLFQEIRDLFYYIQILCQGTFSPAMRRVKDYIPIDSLPDLMRALGFFPSEYEVENIIVEAKYKVNLRDPVTEIDFEEFVKLYLNHRPAFGESFKRMKSSFGHFANFTSDHNVHVMSREDFVDMLSQNGEHFSRELSWYLLSILCGHSFEDRAALTADDFSFLPEEITFTRFVDEIIGMQELDEYITDTTDASTVSLNTCASDLSAETCRKTF